MHKNVQPALVLVILLTICVTCSTKNLLAQQTRIDNVAVHGSPAAQPNGVKTPHPAQSNTSNADAEQLRRLSELTPPPRSEAAEPLLQQLAPVIAEPVPKVMQQIPRTGARSSLSATPEPVKSATPANNAVQAPTADEAEVNITQALELYRQNNFDEAKKMLEDICRADPKLPPPGIFLVQFAATTGQGDRIRYWLDQAAWEHPDDPETWTLLAEFAINDNRLAEAKLLIEKGISLLKNLTANEERRQSIENSADAIQGRLYQLRGDWAKSRASFEKLAAVDKENTEILTRLGFVAANQEKYDDAINFYQQAIAKGAKLPTPKLIVSQIADQQGKTEIADKYFNEVIQATDIDPESIRIAVQIQLRRGNIAEADKFLQQAIKAEPNNYDNLLLAGTIDLFKKDYPAAEKRFQDAILINPESYAAAQGLAQALVEQTDALKKDRALAYAKSNVQKTGESPDSVATLAWVCFKSNKMNEAEHLVKMVMGSGELTPLSAYYFAEITAAIGQTDKALLFAKIAAGSKSNFMKKAEAEALLKKLESGQGTVAPVQPANTSTSSSTGTNTPSSVRFPGTRN
jgi:tetratricopeptide (TPR) repeat protein